MIMIEESSDIRKDLLTSAYETIKMADHGRLRLSKYLHCTKPYYLLFQKSISDDKWYYQPQNRRETLKGALNLYHKYGGN